MITSICPTSFAPSFAPLHSTQALVSSSLGLLNFLNSTFLVFKYEKERAMPIFLYLAYFA
jgi:hypothetical protein